MPSELSTTAPLLPVIETPRLRLRPRTMQDLEASIALERASGTTDPIEASRDDPEAHRAFVRARIRGPYPKGMGHWVIARHDFPDAFLGCVMLIPENAVGPRVETGWRVVEAARGRGYASEAAANLLAHGFGTLGLREIVARIGREHTALRRVAEKIGMTLAEDPAEGAPDCVLYAARIHCAR